jgi:hypothetical protein
MILGANSQQRSRKKLPLAIAMVVFAMGCNDDQTTGGMGGSSGAGGSGGTATGGSGGSAGTATGGSGGEGGSGAAGSGGAAGTGGSSGSSGAAGSGGAAGNGGSAGQSGSSGAGGAGGQSPDGGAPDPKMNFFVTSETSKTGNLGGLVGADGRCQRLAAAVGFGSNTWRAYLSAEAADGGQPIHARDRIGPGPYYNAKGAMLAADKTALHARAGDAELFLDEHGQKINGQWSGSPTPNQHDILTGSNADGTVTVGQTCLNWTSESMSNTAQVGHSDGLGPSMSSTPPLNSWNSSHVSGGCHDTAPRGGAGRFYCFTATTIAEP